MGVATVQLRKGFKNENDERNSMAVVGSGLASSKGLQAGTIQTTPHLSERSNAMFSTKAILWL